MATAVAARPLKDSIFEWEGKDKSGKVVRGDMRAGRRGRRQGHPAPPGRPGHQGQEGRMRRRAIDQGKGRHALHAPAGNDDESRRAAAAGLRHRRQGSTNPAVTKLLMDVKMESRNRLHAVGGVPQVSAVLRPAVLQPGRRRRAGRHPGDRCSIASRPTRKRRSRSSRKIKSALFYPVAIIVVAFVDYGGDHDLRDPGIQAGVHELRRRPARADADRAWRCREFFVAYWWLIFGVSFGGVYVFFAVVETIASRCRSSWTGCCSSCRCSAS